LKAARDGRRAAHHDRHRRRVQHGRLPWPLPEIRALADRYDALVMVDDCHATGFMGPQGRGTPHHFGVRADILTGTLGKALGGALGGYVAGPQPVIDLLRQRARPYLFLERAAARRSCAAGLAALDLVEAAMTCARGCSTTPRYWRAGWKRRGLRPAAGRTPDHPGHAGRGAAGAGDGGANFELGVYVAGFFFPVVPRGTGPHPHPDERRPDPRRPDRALGAFAPRAARPE
jgi:glycine C-acetyltransferase